jgi:hypothetical protein
VAARSPRHRGIDVRRIDHRRARGLVAVRVGAGQRRVAWLGEGGRAESEAIDHPLAHLRAPALATARRVQRQPEEAGRAAVDLILKDFENREQRSPPEARFDFAEVRKDLGLLP